MTFARGLEMGAAIGVAVGTIGADADPHALLDIDYARGRYRARGNVYADETALKAAIAGHSAPGGQLQIGPYVSPEAFNLVPGGDFSTGTGAWETNGGPLAIVDGQLQVTGIGGNTTSAYLYINPVIAASGKAYRLRGKIRRGTAGSAHLGIGGPFSTHNYAGSASVTTTVLAAVELFCGGFHGSNATIAVRHNATPSSGTFYADDIALHEALPLRGFVAGECCGVIEATTPTAGGEPRILFQADDNADFGTAPVERNYLRLIWDADAHLRFIVSFGGSGAQVEQVNLDLGTVASGMQFAVAFSARANDFKAVLIGGPVRSANAGSFPGLASLRLGKGRSDVDMLWTGEIARFRLYPNALAAPAFADFVAGIKP